LGSYDWENTKAIRQDDDDREIASAAHIGCISSKGIAQKVHFEEEQRL
jgi:hypothetical protein